MTNTPATPEPTMTATTTRYEPTDASRVFYTAGRFCEAAMWAALVCCNPGGALAALAAVAAFAVASGLCERRV